MARSSLEYAKGTDTLHLRYAIRAIVLRYRNTKGTPKEDITQDTAGQTLCVLGLTNLSPDLISTFHSYFSLITYLMLF